MGMAGTVDAIEKNLEPKWCSFCTTAKMKRSMAALSKRSGILPTKTSMVAAQQAAGCCDCYQ